VRWDAVRGTRSADFFLLSILHWHFRTQSPCKTKLRTSKTPQDDRFLGKWDIVTLLFGNLRCFPMLVMYCQHER